MRNEIIFFFFGTIVKRKEKMVPYELGTPIQVIIYDHVKNKL